MCNMSIKIDLGDNQFTIIDEIDSDLAHLKWHILSGRYAARKITINKKTPNRKRVYIYLHQIIFERKYGQKSSDKEVADHKNGNILDNTRDNIRITTRPESGYNRKGWGKSGYKGVFANGKKWLAKMTLNGRVKYLGTFNTPEEAYAAYCKEAKEHHGEFINLGHKSQETCPRCNGLGHIYILGDDDTPCPDCDIKEGDLPY